MAFNGELVGKAPISLASMISNSRRRRSAGAAAVEKCSTAIPSARCAASVVTVFHVTLELFEIVHLVDLLLSCSFSLGYYRE